MVFLLFPFAANLSTGTAPEFQLKSVIRTFIEIFNDCLQSFVFYKASFACF